MQQVVLSPLATALIVAGEIERGQQLHIHYTEEAGLTLIPRTLRLRHSRRALAAALSLLIAKREAGVRMPVSHLPADMAQQGWIRLFDGSSHFGWTSGGESGKSTQVRCSQIRLVKLVAHDCLFSDYDLKFEARVTGGPA